MGGVAPGIVERQALETDDDMGLFEACRFIRMSPPR